MMALVGEPSLTFRKFQACGASDYHGAKDSIASRRWLADVTNAFRTSSCPEGADIRLASCLLGVSEIETEPKPTKPKPRN